MTNRLGVEPIDARWFARFSKIASFQVYEYFAGDQKYRDRQKKLFLEDKAENPKLDYPLLGSRQLQQKRIKLKKLLDDIAEQEKNSLVRRAYQKKIKEKITGIDLLLASQRKNWKIFSKNCQKLYSRPTLQGQGHTISWLKKKLDQAEKKNYFGISEDKIVELESFIFNWTKKIPSKYRRIKKPRNAIFQKARKNFLDDFGKIFQPAKKNQAPFDAVATSKIFNSSLELGGFPDWKANVARSNSISISVDIGRKQIKIPHRKKLYLSDLKSLIAHEIGTHVVRQSNGEKSGLFLLGVGLARYEQGEEGIATFREQLTRPQFDDFLGFPGFLPICLALGSDGKKRNFRAVFEMLEAIFFLLKMLGGKKSAKAKREAREEAWERSVRTFRGTDCSTPGTCFMKDIIYREGNIRIWRLVSNKPSLMKDFNIGKYDPANPEHLEIIESLKKLSPD